MTIVNSWNEWDPLKHVIVGTVENSNIPPMEPALEPKISKDSGMVGSHGPRSKESIEKANIKLDNLLNPIIRRATSRTAATILFISNESIFDKFI